jgi:hypothetical protein
MTNKAFVTGIISHLLAAFWATEFVTFGFACFHPFPTSLDRSRFKEKSGARKASGTSADKLERSRTSWDDTGGKIFSLERGDCCFNELSLAGP